MLSETLAHEQFENGEGRKGVGSRSAHNLSELSEERIKDKSIIPVILEAGKYGVIGTKKYKAYSQLVQTKTNEQLSLT